MSSDERIFVAGGSGLVGSAIIRRLARAGYKHIVAPTRSDLELTNQAAVDVFFSSQSLDRVYLAAAKVGGIHANTTYPADFIRENLQVQNNVIDSARRHGVRKLLFLGSSCMYPKFAPQPMSEDCLLTGPLEPTNESYAIAKIAGVKLCQAYRRQYGFNAIVLMPANLYGPGDNFDRENSHVLPALIRKFHEAKQSGDNEVVVWGTGTPRREFMHVDDLADASFFLMQNYEAEQVLNVGWGKDVSIAELASSVREVVGFQGAIRFDSTKSDGAPRRLLDTSRLTAQGWRPSITLGEGISSTYRWFLQTGARARL